MSKKTIYALLAHFCRENYLHAPSGKFLRVKFCKPESLDFLCLWRNVAEVMRKVVEVMRKIAEVMRRIAEFMR